jgi:hypothetical protein
MLGQHAAHHAMHPPTPTGLGQQTGKLVPEYIPAGESLTMENSEGLMRRVSNRSSQRDLEEMVSHMIDIKCHPAPRAVPVHPHDVHDVENSAHLPHRCSQVETTSSEDAFCSKIRS